MLIFLNICFRLPATLKKARRQNESVNQKSPFRVAVATGKKGGTSRKTNCKMRATEFSDSTLAKSPNDSWEMCL